MKKLYITSLLSLIVATPAFSATQWWMHDTVCRLDPTTCYVGMGTGYDAGMWDADAGCRGMKIICGEALSPTQDEPETVGRNDIRWGDGINADFDVTLLNGDCFGRRKTTAGGSQASIDGKFVNVWCSGILNNVDETVPNGEITRGTQPTCQDLADDGYIGVLNDRCYGKSMDLNKYYIDCSGGKLLPSQIIVLNGANYDDSAAATPMDARAAEAKFNTMYSNSKALHDQHFKE